MLSSLFGDLGLAKAKDTPAEWTETRLDNEGHGGFAATAVLESTDTSVNAHGQMVDRQLKDLFVSGSPAEAMRQHFAARSDPGSTGHAITLYDPTRVWAPAVIKALSDASGQPIERLHLRDRASLATLAMIERTRVVRRFDGTLKIYHADVRTTDPGSAQIPVVLMERAHLTAVIIGAMQPESVTETLVLLQQAVREPSWHCPNLLFMLPPSALWLLDRLNSLVWPEALHVTVLQESLSGTSAVWNALLNVWNQAKTVPHWAEAATAAGFRAPGFPIRVADIGAAPGDDTGPDTLANPAAVPPLDAERAEAALLTLGRSEGLLGCAIVDEQHATLLARQARGVDLELTAAASTQLLRAHRAAARAMGGSEVVDEVVQGTPAQHLVIRMLRDQPGRYMLAVLDRQRANLALVRYRMQEAEKALG